MLCAVLVSALLLVISLFHYLHRPTHIEGFDYLKYVALGAVALEGPLVGLKAFLSLRRKVCFCFVRKYKFPLRSILRAWCSRMRCFSVS